MAEIPLYPLRFEPIFKDYLWGGRRLARWFTSAPASGPVAEAWLVSDEAANPSLVLNGPLAGRSLRELMASADRRLISPALPRDGRFPLLLKFLDAEAPLSVQVHPTDEQAARLGASQQGKTEAWVVLRAEPDSRIYAGLKLGVTPEAIRQALAEKRLADCLHSYIAKVGDCIYLPAGTVHALGAGLMIFEVQQTSDITYRLHDWDRINEKTGQPRPLHIEEGLACTNFDFGPCRPLQPAVEGPNRECLVNCKYFRLCRIRANAPFAIGAAGECRIVVGIEGEAHLAWGGRDDRIGPGDALLLPAQVGECRVVPRGSAVLLEVGLPRCEST